jgi:hypothetical protein
LSSTRTTTSTIRGGLRTAVAEGATLVTSELARPYFEKTLANPNRLSPDAMQKSGRTAQLTGVNGAAALHRR